MRVGKISENTLKRSVIKNTNINNTSLVHGASLRDNCAVFSFEDKYTVTSTHQVILPDALDSLHYSILRGANNLAACEAVPQAVSLAILLPEDYEEPQLADLMKEAKDVAEKLSMSIAGGSTKTGPGITKPVISVTVIGARKNKDLCEVKPDWDIIITKPVGLSGTAVLANEKYDELKKRYPARYIEEAKSFSQETSALSEAAVAMKSGLCRMFAVSEGGIFASLWETARIAGVGLEVDLKRIPIRQETVEICDCLGINPYELMSDGALLIMAPEGEPLVEALNERGFDAAIVGKTRGDNDKIIRNDDEVRYVDKPAADSIYKLFE